MAKWVDEQAASFRATFAATVGIAGTQQREFDSALAVAREAFMQSMPEPPAVGQLSDQLAEFMNQTGALAQRAQDEEWQRLAARLQAQEEEFRAEMAQRFQSVAPPIETWLPSVLPEVYQVPSNQNRHLQRELADAYAEIESRDRVSAQQAVEIARLRQENFDLKLRLRRDYWSETEPFDEPSPVPPNDSPFPY